MELMEKQGNKQTEVGNINLYPKDWKHLNLGNSAILKARIGWQGLTTAEYLKTGEYYLITGTDFNDGYIDWDNCVYVEKLRFDQDKNIQVKIGDVLVTKDGTIGKVAYVDKLPKNTTLNSGVFVIRPINNSYHPRYFYYVLMSEHFKQFLGKLTAGSTISHLYQKDFVNYDFPIPPTLEEQKAIATALSDVDELITNLDKLIAKKRVIKQGAMQQLLTPKENWQTRTTKDLCDKLWIGLVTTMTSNYVKHGVPLVRNSDIKVNRFRTDLINLEQGFANTHKSRAFQVDDVITVHTGDVGTSAVVPEWLNGAHGFATINSRLKRNTISPWYYSYYLNSPLLKNQLNEVITGDGRSNLNLYDFVNLKVSFPSLEEQNLIVDILFDMDKEIENLDAKKNKYLNIKQGMMQELLTGKTRLL